MTTGCGVAATVAVIFLYCGLVSLRRLVRRLAGV